MLHFQTIFDLLVVLLPKVLPLVEPAKTKSNWPKSFDKYPNLSYRDNGFPTITTYPTKIDVADFFRQGYGKQKPIIDLNEISEYQEIIKIFTSTPNIVSYFKLSGKLDVEIDFLRWQSEYLINSMIAYYYYQYGVDFSVEKLLTIFKPLDTYFNSERIHFDISIPILFVKFELDYFEITPNLIVRKISDEANRARYSITSYSPAIVDSVFMSATHELVLKDYSYDRPHNWNYSPFSHANIYPHDIFQKYISILHLVTNYNIGYSQLLIYPNNWRSSYHMDLMELQGTTVRAYPSIFDNFYWNTLEFPIITSEQLTIVKELYNKASSYNGNKLELALKRFYKSMMREEEDDIIIDLIIALEMLLSDNEKGEITHKLALRISALLGKFSSNNYNSLTVFANVKKIYAYRSSIVHGSHKLDSKREIKLEENKNVAAVDLAKKYLSEILTILIKNPIYFKPNVIDELLLSKS